MNFLDQAVHWLAEQQSMPYTRNDPYLEVAPQCDDAYMVWVHEGEWEFTIGMDGAHVHCDSIEDALTWLQLACSDQCRIRVHLQGDFAYRWVIERCRDDLWDVVHTTCLMFWPFWRRARVEWRYFDQSPRLFEKT